MKTYRMVALSLGAWALAACTETTGLDRVAGNASNQDRQEILAAIDAAQFSSETFDVDGLATDFQMVDPVGAGIAPAASAEPVTLPRLWGRRWGQPVERTRTVNIKDDTATVDIAVRFEGRLLVLLPRDGAPPDTLSNPLEQTFLHQAVLIKASEPNSERKWKLIKVSPAQFIMTDAAKRTTKVTEVVIAVNGQVKIDVTDPNALYDIDASIPKLAVGDVVTVTARVSNTANTGNTPDTFVFLHLMHARNAGLGWTRIPMEKNQAGEYVRTWTVRREGRERIGVDAIDSQSFQAGAGKEYRSNAWGIPYRIGQ